MRLVDVRVRYPSFDLILADLFRHSEFEENRERLPPVHLKLLALVHVQNNLDESCCAFDSVGADLPDVHVGE